jgi:PAS domain S-box-containing protein
VDALSRNFKKKKNENCGQKKGGIIRILRISLRNSKIGSELKRGVRQKADSVESLPLCFHDAAHGSQSMSKNDLERAEYGELHAKAAAKVDSQIVKLRGQYNGNLEKILHELGVYQVELDMQNEELRRMQAELEESRSKYADLYNYAPMGYFTIDKNGLVFEANLTGCAMLGIERANLIKKPLSVFLSQEDADRFYLHRKSVMMSGIKQTCEITIRRKDGSSFDAMFESTVVEDAKSKEPVIRMILTNITERKRAEDELRKLASVVEHSSEFIGMASLDDKIIFLNDAAAAMLGITADETHKTSILDVVSDNCKEKVKNEVLPTQKEKGYWEGELQYQNLKTGKITDVYATTFTINDPKTGKPLYLANTSIDITELKQAQEALKATAQFRRAVIDSLPANIAILDEHGTVISVNEAWLRFGKENGAPNKETAAEGSNYIAVCRRAATEGDSLAAEAMSGIEDILAGRRQRFSIQYPCHSPDKQRWFVMIAVRSMPTGGSVIITHLDITERKLAEQAVEESRRSVEKEKNLLQSVMKSTKNSHLVYLDRDFNFVRVNEAYAKTCGYKPEEMIGKNHFALYPSAENEAIFARVRDTGIPAEFHDNPFVFPDQPERGITYWDWTLVPVEGDSDNVEGLVFSLVETTARKRAEDALRESEIRYRKFFEEDLTGDFIAEPDGKIIFCNPAFADIFGFASVEEAIGSNVADLYTSRQSWGSLVKLIKEQKSLARHESERKRRDGRAIDTIENISGNFDERGELTQFKGYVFEDTDRKRAEKALSESRERYKLLFDKNPDAVFAVDVQGKFMSVNKASEVLSGYSAKELLGKTFMELCAPDQLERTVEEFRKCLTQPAYRELETALIRKDGQRVEVWVTGDVMWKDEQIVEIFCTAKNITERKLAEEMLRERMKEISCLYAVSRDIQEDLSIEELCRRAVSHLVQAMQFPEITVPLIEVYGNRYTGENYTEGLSQGLGAEIRIKGEAIGHLRVYYTEKKPFLVPEEQVLVDGVAGIIGTWLERRQAEEAVAVALNRYRSFLEITGQLGWTTNADGEVVEDLPLWRLFTGQSVEDIKGWGWSKAVHPDDIESVRETWQKAVRTSTNYECEYRIRRHDGVYRYFMVRGVPVFVNGGSVREWVGTCIDITDRKEAQQQLEHLTDELEHKNEELESIIRIASHDLRSPLMNIKGFAGELAKDIGKLHKAIKEERISEELTEKAEMVFTKYVPEAVGFIESSADSINNMIKSLMDVAKAGTVKINIQNLDMNALLAKAVSNARFKLEQCGGQIDIEPLYFCRGDDGQITQVFTNIIENAIKYREPSRPLKIQVYASAEPDKVTYCVEDNGKGIAEDHLDKVFDLFARLDPEAAAGEGIGLTIVKRMVERQGGKIWANSQVGKGSKFFMSLPR